MNEPRRALARTLRLLGNAAFAIFLCNTHAALAETPQEFVAKLEKTDGVKAMAIKMDDGRFGGVSVGLDPKLLAGRDAADSVLAELGRFAAAEMLRVRLLAPDQETANYVAERLKAAAAPEVTVRVMAPTVTNKTTRVLLTPPPAEKPMPAPPQAAPAGKGPPPGGTAPSK